MNDLVSIRFTKDELRQISIILKCYLGEFKQDYIKQYMQKEITLIKYIDKFLIEKTEV